MLSPRAALPTLALVAFLAAPSTTVAKPAKHRSCPGAIAGPAIGYDLPEPRFVHSQLTTDRLSCAKGEVVMDAFAQRHTWPVRDESIKSRVRGYRCVARFEFDIEGRWADGVIVCRKADRKIRWVASGPAPDGPDGGLD